MQRVLCIALLSFLVLTGCSSTKLAYRYADWGIVWWVDDYVPMTSQQKSRLEQDIRDLRQWHCSTELPLYSRWLGQLKSDVRAGNLDQSVIAGHQETLFAFFQPLVNRAKPAVTGLLASLSDEQVQQLAANMKDSQEELEAEFLGDSPEETRAARAERTGERVERWLGSLNERQRKTVNAWSDARGEQTKIWLEGRRNWQQALLEALEQRRSEDFADRISYLIDNNEEVRGDRYQQMMSESQMAMAALMADLLEQADQRHLDHLVDRATELEKDFDTLACVSKGAESRTG